jgi:hypothetical protein
MHLRHKCRHGTAGHLERQPDVTVPAVGTHHARCQPRQWKGPAPGADKRLYVQHGAVAALVYSHDAAMILTGAAEHNAPARLQGLTQGFHLCHSEQKKNIFRLGVNPCRAGRRRPFQMPSAEQHRNAGADAPRTSGKFVETIDVRRRGPTPARRGGAHVRCRGDSSTAFQQHALNPGPCGGRYRRQTLERRFGSKRVLGGA